MRLQESLVLQQYICDLIGGDYEELIDSLREADEVRRADGQSSFFSIIEARSTRLKIPLDNLRDYDLNVLEHERAIAKRRPGLRLRYFQWLAALFSETYLHALVTDPVGLLIGLNALRASALPDLPEYQPADLRRLSFWMATGSGKTLLLHMNLRQFMHYRPFDPANILLLTPSYTLALQHLDELRLSGVACEYAIGGSAISTKVQVLEIFKLYVDVPQTRTRRGGVSLPVSQFEGPNLVFVDEGHKGGATTGEMKEEQAWRRIREALSEGGFTFEYSATFGQVTEASDELLVSYARSIGFEYAYARFFKDGFGKSFRAVNLRESGYYNDDLLLAGLLTFFEKYRLYEDEREAFGEYHLAKPLHIFVGAQVNAGPEVLQVVEFLNRVLTEKKWAKDSIRKLLKGQSGLPGPDGRDLFGDAFPYLRAIGISANQCYGELSRSLFGGEGRLSLHLLQRCDGEIGIRATDAARDAYCGVINVGNAPAFLDKVEEESFVEVGPDDFFTESLFGGIDEPLTSVNFLVGSKKFIEGWSSWRVAVMALLRVGSKAGAQVLQLFGRGVRLKGKRFGLKRSSSIQGPHPPYLQLLEELNVFGLKANYLKTFLDTLLREGVQPAVTRILPVTLQKGFVEAGLKSLALDPCFDFVENVVLFDGKAAPVTIDVSVSTQAGAEKGLETAKQHFAPAPIPPSSLELLDLGHLVAHARRHKVRRGWFGLFIDRQEIVDFLTSTGQVAAPESVLNPKSDRNLRELERLAERLVEKGVDAFYLPEQRRSESTELQETLVDTEHPNFPRAGSGVGYLLDVPADQVETIDSVLQDVSKLSNEDLLGPLPRLHWDRHLYNPILARNGIRSRPTGLERSETRFLKDLREFWATNALEEPWARYEVFVLRNLPKRGVGFFQTAGFYPDFLVWLKEGDRQGLAFVDPKGLMLVGEFNEKLRLAETLESAEFGFPVTSFIVTPTPLAKWPPHQGLNPKELPARREALAARHIYEQRGDYMARLMAAFEEIASSELPEKVTR